MSQTSPGKFEAIAARLAGLHRRRRRLTEQIEAELRRPLPCSVALQELKRTRLHLKDQIARHSALLRNSRAIQTGTRVSQP